MHWHAWTVSWESVRSGCYCYAVWLRDGPSARGNGGIFGPFAGRQMTYAPAQVGARESILQERTSALKAVGGSPVGASDHEEAAMSWFGRRKRDGASQDQVMAVDVQLEDHIREIEGLVAGYLRSPQDEATRQALSAELDKLDDQTARADAYGNFKSVLVRYQEPRSWVSGATTDSSTAEDVPSAEFKAQVALMKAAKTAIRDTTAEAQPALQRANDELAGVLRHEARG